MQLSFRKYDSIVNTSNEKQRGDIFEYNPTLADIEWVATEKVHGANFSFITDGESINLARRSGLIKPTETFHGSREVLARIRENILAAFRIVQRTMPDVAVVTIYGELFGGEYPHPDVPRNSKLKQVQKGVYYSPSVEFYAFDLLVRRATSPPASPNCDAEGEGAAAASPGVDGQEGQKPAAESDKGQFLPFDEALQIFREAGIFHSQPLLRGSFEEVMAFDVEAFTSTVPLRLGLPPLPGAAQLACKHPAWYRNTSGDGDGDGSSGSGSGSGGDAGAAAAAAAGAVDGGGGGGQPEAKQAEEATAAAEAGAEAAAAGGGSGSGSSEDAVAAQGKAGGKAPTPGTPMAKGKGTWGNIAEGVVIRPAAGGRAYFKKKASMFHEVANAASSKTERKAARRTAQREARERKMEELKATPSAAPMLAVLAHVERHLTDNRLRNVLSKLPRVRAAAQAQKIGNLLLKDAMVDYRAEHEEPYLALTKAERQFISTEARALSLAVVEQNMGAILSGDF